MTVLLQTRVPRELAARFKSSAQAEGKSTYQVLRELAERFANEKRRRQFACSHYPERIALPSPSRLRTELHTRMRNRHEKVH